MRKIFLALALAGSVLLGGCGAHGGYGYDPYAYRPYYLERRAPVVGYGTYTGYGFSIVPDGCLAGYGRIIGNNGVQSTCHRLGHSALDEEVCWRYKYCFGVGYDAFPRGPYGRRSGW